MTVLNDLLVLTGLFIDKSIVMNCRAGIEAQHQSCHHLGSLCYISNLYKLAQTRSAQNNISASTRQMHLADGSECESGCGVWQGGSPSELEPGWHQRMTSWFQCPPSSH